MELPIYGLSSENTFNGPAITLCVSNLSISGKCSGGDSNRFVDPTFGFKQSRNKPCVGWPLDIDQESVFNFCNRPYSR